MGYGVFLKGMPIEAVPELTESDLTSGGLARMRGEFDAGRGPATPLLPLPVQVAVQEQPHPALRQYLIDSLVALAAGGTGPLGRDGAELLLASELDLSLSERAIAAYGKALDSAGPDAVPAAPTPVPEDWEPEAIAVEPRYMPPWLSQAIAGRLAADAAAPPPESPAPTGAGGADPFAYIKAASAALKGVAPEGATGPTQRPGATIADLLESGSELHPPSADATPSALGAPPPDHDLADLAEGEQPLIEAIEARYSDGLKGADWRPGQSAVSIVSVDTLDEFLSNNDVMVTYVAKRL